MKAFTRFKYGGPDVLNLQEVEKPNLKNDHVLVRVHANSINAADWRILRGKPFLARLAFGLFKPKNKIPGADFAGIIEAVGPTVSRYKVGDWVFGESIQGGAFAQYISIHESLCGLMPIESNFLEMACLPLAGITALQALINHGKIKQGESVVINGASGGVGLFTVQIAKAKGAMVTAICSKRNVELVKSYGADHVFSYDDGSLNKLDTKHDLAIDVFGNLTYQNYSKWANRGVLVGFTNFQHLLSTILKCKLKGFPLSQFTAETNPVDLNTLADMFHHKTLQPHIEKIYSFEHLPEAIQHVESMHTKGKIVVSWTPNS